MSALRGGAAGALKSLPLLSDIGRVVFLDAASDIKSRLNDCKLLKFNFSLKKFESDILEIFD
jgi:hypothetical protein